MNMAQSLIPIARQTFAQPREAAGNLLSLGIPRTALWPAFWIVVIATTLLVTAGSVLSEEMELSDFSVLPTFLITAALSGGSILAIHRVGRAMGGTGAFEETLLLMVFLQGVILVVQIAELVLILLIPGMGGVFTLVLAVFAFWVNLNFIDALHGFGSLMRSFLVLLLSSLAVAVVLGVALGTAGLMPGMPV